MRGMAALVAAALLAGCGSSEVHHPNSTAASTPSGAASPRSSVAGPWATTAPPALNFTDAADEQFLGALRKKGVAITDEDDMILAGNNVCLMMVNEGSTLIDASAWVMDVYEVSGDLAGDIAVTAVDVYCPTQKP